MCWSSVSIPSSIYFSEGLYRYLYTFINYKSLDESEDTELDGEVRVLEKRNLDAFDGTGRDGRASSHEKSEGQCSFELNQHIPILSLFSVFVGTFKGSFGLLVSQLRALDQFCKLPHTYINICDGHLSATAFSVAKNTRTW